MKVYNYLKAIHRLDLEYWLPDYRLKSMCVHFSDDPLKLALSQSNNGKLWGKSMAKGRFPPLVTG